MLRSGSHAMALAAAAALAVAVLFPVLSAGFFGDDITLWHEGRKMLDDPSSVLVGPPNFYRPANSWLFAAHQLLFGPDPFGYHVVVLLMHLACGLLLGRLVGRFIDSPWAVFAAAAVWLCSPFTFGSVQFVNIAYNDLTVILVWLALANLWPDPGHWSRWRLAAAGGLIAFSAFCKESWVIVPGLAFALELGIGRKRFRPALRTAAWIGVPVAAYVAVYVVVFQGRGSYYDIGPWALTKAPHMWASFSLLSVLEATRPTFGLGEGVASLAMIGLAFLGWKRRSPLIGIGFTFFFLSLLPILFIPYNPTRYTAAPLLGFVLVMAGACREIARLTPQARRRLATTGIVTATVLLLGIGLVWVRGEIGDMQRLRRHYTKLFAETDAFADRIPADRTLICVRLEETDPLRKLLAEGALGVPKTYYHRAWTPYGLATWAHLLTLARAGRGDEIFLDGQPADLTGGEYRVIGHVDGGFRLLPSRADSALAEWMIWRRAGYPVQLALPKHAHAAHAAVAAQ